jgi:hypothetical protein
LAPLSDKDPVSGEMPKNPWSKDSLNVTEQMFIAKENPELAEYLKATKDGATYSTLKATSALGCLASAVTSCRQCRSHNRSRGTGN